MSSFDVALSSSSSLYSSSSSVGPHGFPIPVPSVHRALSTYGRSKDFVGAFPEPVIAQLPRGATDFSAFIAREKLARPPVSPMPTLSSARLENARSAFPAPVSAPSSATDFSEFIKKLGETKKTHVKKVDDQKNKKKKKTSHATKNKKKKNAK